jgi:hypothetical protein
MSAALLNGVNKAMVAVVAVVAVVTVLADLSLTRIEMENLVFRSIIVTSAPVPFANNQVNCSIAHSTIIINNVWPPINTYSILNKPSGGLFIFST